MPEHDAPERVSDELLPCPFCGQEATLKENSYESHLRERHRMFMAYCSNSTCIAFRNQSTSRDAVVAAWNRRASPAPVSGVTDPQFPEALSDDKVRIWITSCNHEPARQALRQLLAYRVRGHAAALSLPTPSDQLAETVPDRLNRAAYKIAMDEWFSGEKVRRIEDVEAFAKRIRSVLLKEATQLARPYLDRALKAEAAPPAPVEVTEAMVDAAARAMWKASAPPTQEDGFPEHDCIARKLYTTAAYAALTAALQASKPSDQGAGE